MVDRTAELSNFLNETTAEKAVFVRSCQKYGLDAIGQGFVSMRHLQLFLKIGKNSQAAQQDASLTHLRIGDGQPVKTIDLDIRQVLCSLLDLLNPLLHRKERRFAGIVHDHNNDSLIELTAPLNDV